MIPDIMHDVLEGALQYETNVLLAHIINEARHLQLSKLNHIIECVELGYMESSSWPSPILNMEDKHLKQNGMIKPCPCKWTKVIVIRLSTCIYFICTNSHYIYFTVDNCITNVVTWSSTTSFYW